MGQTVIGVFASTPQAQKAVTALKSAGFGDAHIDFDSQESYTTNEHRTARKERNKGFFAELFSDDDDYTDEHTTAFTEASRRGTVVTVHTQDMKQAEEAADILDQNGAVDANQAHASLQKRGVKADDHATTLEVIKEDLAVGKREVETGGVRVRSRIVAKPVTESVRLREEHVTVNRIKVDRPVSADALDTFKEGTISVTEKAEVPVVQKSARVVEEISVGKTATERTEQITETVRETKVDVDKVAGNGTNRVAGTAGTTRTKGRDAGNPVANALDRDNDGEVVDLNDGDGRVG